MSKDEQIVRYTAEELAEKRSRGESLSDWERVRNMTEEELEASIDVAEEGEIDWDGVLNNMVATNRVHVDTDVLVWFLHQGPGYENRINQVLRSYVQSQRDKRAS